MPLALLDLKAFKVTRVLRTSRHSRTNGCYRRYWYRSYWTYWTFWWTYGPTGPTGPSFPIATIVVTNNIQQTVLQFNNFIFSTAINVNNIIFNGTDTVTVINGGIYVISVSISTTAPGCAPLGVGISINGAVATDNFSSNLIGDSLSFTTIETLAAGARISVQST